MILLLSNADTELLALRTILHRLPDGFRAALLGHVAKVAGKRWSPGAVGFAAARTTRLDAVADAIEAHLDLDRLADIISAGRPTEDVTS